MSSELPSFEQPGGGTPDRDTVLQGRHYKTGHPFFGNLGDPFRFVPPSSGNPGSDLNEFRHTTAQRGLILRLDKRVGLRTQRARQRDWIACSESFAPGYSFRALLPVKCRAD